MPSFIHFKIVIKLIHPSIYSSTVLYGSILTLLRVSLWLHTLKIQQIGKSRQKVEENGGRGVFYLLLPKTFPFKATLYSLHPYHIKVSILSNVYVANDGTMVIYFKVYLSPFCKMNAVWYICVILHIYVIFSFSNNVFFHHRG